MADKPTYTSVTADSQLKAATVNTNMENMAVAIENGLGRGGINEANNSMAGILDMDNNRIQNLGDPINPKDAVTLSFINTLASSGSELGFATIIDSHIALAGQTVFNLNVTYQQAFNNIAVYKSGLRLNPDEYEETTSQSVTLLSAASGGEVVLFIVNQPVSTVDPNMIPAGQDLLTASSAAVSAAGNAQVAQGLAEDARDAAIVAQNAAEYAASTVPTIPSIIGNGLSFMRVNSGETAFEYRTPTQIRGDISLGDSATKNVGTTSGTVCAGDDTRITNAVLNDLRGITFAQGDILYYNGTNLVKLVAGTSGYYLKTLGAGANPQWAAVSAGGMWSYVSKGTASNSATLDFTGLDHTTYDYKFVLRDLIPGTTSNALQMLTGYSTGPTWNVVDYSYGVLGYDHLGAGAHLNGNDTTNIALTNNMSTSEKVYGEVETTWLSDGFKTNFKLNKAYASTSPTLTMFTGSGISFTNPVTGIQFKYGSGNIASGVVEMWRRTKQ